MVCSFVLRIVRIQSYKLHHMGVDNVPLVSWKSKMDKYTAVVSIVSCTHNSTLCDSLRMKRHKQNM